MVLPFQIPHSTGHSVGPSLTIYLIVLLFQIPHSTGHSVGPLYIAPCDKALGHLHAIPQ